MKNIKILILFFVASYFLYCKKENKIGFSYYNSFKSTIDGTLNGNSWKKNNWTLLGIFRDINPSVYTNQADSSTRLQCLVHEDRFTLTIAQFNEQNQFREQLFIMGISKKKGRFGVIPRVFPNCDIKDSVTLSFVTLQSDGDVGKDFYDKVDTKNSNYIEITSFASNQVKGAFDVKFIMTRRRDEPGAIYPDTLHLKGTFDVKN